MLTAEKTELKQTLTSPIEVANLYGPYLNKVSFFTNTNSLGQPGVNNNQQEAMIVAAGKIVEAKRNGQGINLAIFGPMFAGKTTTICLLAEELGEQGHYPVVYKHKKDVVRTGCQMRNHTGDVITEAKLYKSINELDKALVLLVDEFQFDDIDSSEQIAEFLQRRKGNGLITVFSQLDFNFRREPWKTTQPLLKFADHVLVLAARCADCGDHAWFPQRNKNGQPASINDPEEMVGAEELYQAKCWQHHQVGGKGPSSLVPSDCGSSAHGAISGGVFF